MAHFILIVFCLLVGIALRACNKLPANAHQAFNTFIIYVSLPALALLNLPSLNLSLTMIFPVIMAWLLFLVGTLFFVALGKRFHWQASTIGALVLTGGLANTSFVGFPLLEAFYGPSSLSIAILTDQPGSFAVLSTLGVGAACFFSGTSLSLFEGAKKLLLFPPFITLVAVLLFLRGLTFSPEFSDLLRKLASPLVPLALVSVGFQLSFKSDLLKEYASTLATGLLYKLLLAPLLIAGVFWQLGARGEVFHISVVESAMAPMITGAILAADFGLDHKLANLMVSIGIPLSLLTIPLWVQVLQRLEPLL